MAGCWGYGRTAATRRCTGDYRPELLSLRRPVLHTPSQNPRARLASLPNPNYTDSAGPGSTDKPFGGNPKPRSSYSENLPPPEGRKDQESQHFPAPHASPPWGHQPEAGGAAAIFTLRFPALQTNLGFRTPQSTQLRPQQSQEA